MATSYLRRTRRIVQVGGKEPEPLKRITVQYQREPVQAPECDLERAANAEHVKTYHVLPKRRRKGVIEWPKAEPRCIPYCKKAIWLKALVGHDGDACVFFPGAHPGFVQRVTFNYRSISASRAMCIWANGLPKNQKDVALHSCGNGHLSCINPKHLRWGSRADNTADAKLHNSRSVFPDGMTRKIADEVRVRNELPNVLAVEYDVPSVAIKQVKLGRPRHDDVGNR